jgi:N-methylhydantoinase B/oxoprolinase/acetone carboxylase alpha subunit
MIRTANSALFVEGRDFSCAIVDPDAELVASANFDPSHLSAIAFTVEYSVLYFGRDNIRAGDVYLVNDPYRGGGHLPDISMIRPIFHGAQHIGFAVNRAHHIDIGGMAVAGFPGTAQSIYQEGLRIPPVRWFAEGQENLDVIEMITLNMRFPRDQLGDFKAQLASTFTAEQRLQRLAERYGADTVLACMGKAKNHSEELMRAIIDELPDGTYSFDEFMEDDGVTDTPYLIHVDVSVKGSDVTVDFSGSSPQAKGPINSSYGNTLSSTYNAMLQLAGPEVPFNHGCFRPVEVIAPRGTMLNPFPPAPCFGGVTEVSIRIIDAVLGALAPIAPERVGAGSYGTCVNFSGGGFDEERGADFGFYFFVEGGWGASAWRDGWNCTPNPTSNFNDYPVEWVESTLPLIYREARLNTDSGGAGRFRGGLGTVRTFAVMADDVEINGLGERMKIPPFGLSGGHPGGLSHVFVQHKGENTWHNISEAFGTVSPSKFHGVRGRRDDVFQIVAGGGGGFGPPQDRPIEAVVDDVRNGFVSHETARKVYGVVVIEKNGDLAAAEEESRRLRDQLSRDTDPAVATFEAVIGESLEKRAKGDAGPRAAWEQRNVERLVARAQFYMNEKGVPDIESPPGFSLKNPFLNRRALEYWDSDSFRRWMSRHDFMTD